MTIGKRITERSYSISGLAGNSPDVGVASCAPAIVAPTIAKTANPTQNSDEKADRFLLLMSTTSMERTASAPAGSRCTDLDQGLQLSSQGTRVFYHISHTPRSSA